MTSVVKNPADLQRIIAEAGGGPHYVYVLRRPDGAGLGTPFYVGIGQGMRIFCHEEEARDPNRSNGKLVTIRSIWSEGKEVVRTIDSVHQQEPWDREEELINSLGRLAEGTGPLINAQTYSLSRKVDGVELRKYAAHHEATADLNSIPTTFKLRSVRLLAGPREPRSRNSVFGKIYSVAEAHPGVSGEELIKLLQDVDFSQNKSAYTQTGKVSASWLAGYIEGAFFRSDRQHLQEDRAHS